MEYIRFNDTIFARIDKDEEVLQQLQVIATKEHIKLAHFHALGATDDFTVGVYDVASKHYDSHNFTGPYEIVSLTGTINTMDGNYYCHAHMSCANNQGNVVGGHLNKALISATCELVLTIVNGHVDRYKDNKTGLNLFKF